MKTLTLLARLSAVFFLMLVARTPAFAQTAATGTIEGRVFDSARGTYLENARVSVEGTTIEALTDDGGYYVLGGVPAGAAKLRVFFTGLAAATLPVQVTAGQATVKDVTLSALSGKPPAASGDTVKLSEFVVSTSKEMDGAAIAINEQRAARNIINVVTADEFGTIADGTPGEAIKFLPGVMLTYSAGEAREVSINGVPTANVPVTVGGFDLASNAGGGTGRQTNFEQVSINNMSRIEIIMSPTPESQGSALGGSVNMVPRSAFERSKPSFNYSIYEMMKDNARTFNKTPGGALREPYRKITPGFQVSAVVPVNKRFGFTFSANGATQYAPNDVIALQWRGANVVTNGNAFPDTTPDRPYLTQVQVNDDLRLNKTTSAGLTFDFKLTPRDTISLSAMYTYVTVDHIGHRMTFSVLRVAPTDFGPTFTHGAKGQGRVQLEDVNSRYWLGSTSMETITYRHNGSLWKAEAGAAYSYAGQHNRDIARGILRNSVAQRTNVTINFDDIFYLRPNQISITDGTTGAPVDPYRLDNYALTSANYQEDNWLTFRTTAYGNIARNLTVRDIPVTLKTGFDVRTFARDVRGPQVALTPSVAATPANPGANNASPFLDEMLSQRTLPYGFGAAQFVDNSELYRFWQTNPTFFSENANTIYRSLVTTSKKMTETISAAYLRGDAAFFNRRLQLVGGARVEQTNTTGEGPLTDPTRNYQRDAAGNVRTDAAGKPLLMVPVNTNNLAYSELTFIERGSKTDKEYLRILPSINATYNIRENLRLQTAYYHSLGRPNYNQYANGITLPDTDVGPIPNNSIKVNNAGIKAWSAKTVKVRLEYYFQGVGSASIGAYRRDFKDFFGTTTLLATPEFLQLYALDPALYEGYYVDTNYNIPGTVRTTGLEFAYKQALTFLPHWARGVQVFANATVQRITGNEGRSQFTNTFFPRTGSWGISLSRPKYTVRANWNYRSRIRHGEITGRGLEPGTFDYDGERLFLDLSGEYYFSRRLGLFASFRNVNDVTDNGYGYGPNTPAYARFNNRNDFSAAWTFGVKGTF